MPWVSESELRNRILARLQVERERLIDLGELEELAELEDVEAKMIEAAQSQSQGSSSSKETAPHRVGPLPRQ